MRQALLRDYQAAQDGATTNGENRSREYLEQEILDLLQAGATIEPGPLTAHMQIARRRRLNVAALEHIEHLLAPAPDKTIPPWANGDIGEAIIDQMTLASCLGRRHDPRAATRDRRLDRYWKKKRREVLDQIELGYAVETGSLAAVMWVTSRRRLFVTPLPDSTHSEWPSGDFSASDSPGRRRQASNVDLDTYKA
ncbi:MAG: hypothetical protein DWQ31_18260 [Planctomycetota bacterium]|nr:MAG: hypothetical protein DWQ31_18260 [Planctomycetota bacterium]REJ87308.1 MAG: hypothetical protein DWQ35_21600 [Planctomycetota bacterium]REK22679.1 MAG: hypothetical protein DWQ42_16645 [Planctomycetota bacterium]REK42488.1 MAG: hypothetical protein DWQ46_12945 [Planctomycetota bacterium]